MPDAAVYPLWGSLSLDRTAQSSLQDQIVGYFRDAILAGRIPAGRRIPSSRQLSNEHGISRTTAIEAYDRLTAEGYLYSKQRAGLFVCESLPDDFLLAPPARSRRPAEFDDAATAMPFDPRRYRMALAPGMPAVDRFPWKQWARLNAQVLRERPMDALYYGDPRGEFVLRSAIAEYLGGARGINCAPDQIFIFSSSKHGVDMAARLLAPAGGQVWLEEPGHPLTRNLMEKAGLAPVSVAVDRKGLDVAEARRRAPDARLALVSPSHQYGSGVTMSLDRRLELLHWAEREDGWIVEDDHDGEYRYSGRPIAPLYTLDRAGRVIYIGSFSNLLAPGLRMGYIVTPPALTRTFMLTGASMVSLLEQTVVARFIAGGGLAAHLRRMRKLHSHRRELLIEALDRYAADVLDVGEAPEAGMWVAARTRRPCDDETVAQRAADVGVFVHPLSIYYAGPKRNSGFMVGFASTPENEIAPAVERLARLVRSAS
jgi:GntR family transcriptional regulator/MocR family aminotransferase